MLFLMVACGEMRHCEPLAKAVPVAVGGLLVLLGIYFLFVQRRVAAL